MTVTATRLAKPAPSLDPMIRLVADDMNAVNQVIIDRMASEIPLIPQLAGHLIAGGGKRMRPMLTLASAQLLGYRGTSHHVLAAARSRASASGASACHRPRSGGPPVAGSAGFPTPCGR